MPVLLSYRQVFCKSREIIWLSGFYCCYSSLLFRQRWAPAALCFVWPRILTFLSVFLLHTPFSVVTAGLRHRRGAFTTSLSLLKTQTVVHYSVLSILVLLLQPPSEAGPIPYALGMGLSISPPPTPCGSETLPCIYRGALHKTLQQPKSHTNYKVAAATGGEFPTLPQQRELLLPPYSHKQWIFVWTLKNEEFPVPPLVAKDFCFIKENDW